MTQEQIKLQCLEVALRTNGLNGADKIIEASNKYYGFVTGIKTSKSKKKDAR